ncbi:hypothetical protein V2G26_019172 [Clonostachys chloroleuca]
MEFPRGTIDINSTGGSTSSTSNTANRRASFISTQSTSDPALSSNSSQAAPCTQTMSSATERAGKPRWFSQIKDWLSVSEPSAQAMKEQRTRTYKKFGVDAKDPQAAASYIFLSARFHLERRHRRLDPRQRRRSCRP